MVLSILFIKSLVDSAVLLNHLVSFYLFGSYILFYKHLLSFSVFHLKTSLIDIVCFLFFIVKHLRFFLTADVVARLFNFDTPLLCDSALPEAWELDAVTLAILYLKPLISPTRVKDLLDAFLYYKLDNKSFDSGAAYQRNSLRE